MSAQEETPDLSEKFKAIERNLNPPKQPEQILAKFKGPDGGPWSNTMGMKFVPVPGTRVLFSIWETRVKDFRPFASATNLKQDGASLLSFKDNDSGGKSASLVFDESGSWTNPGFTQTDDHPVICVNWLEACHFCEWLTDKERGDGKIDPEMRYRLPTHAEWKTAVGGETTPWGGGLPAPNSGNFFGKEGSRNFPGSGWKCITGYEDDWDKTAPVGSFPPNRFQLFDMWGNVFEWCANPSQPLRAEPSRPFYVIIGSSWCFHSIKFQLREAPYYLAMPASARDIETGFRVVLAAEPHGPDEDVVVPLPQIVPAPKPTEKPAPTPLPPKKDAVKPRSGGSLRERTRQFDDL